jgi:DNA-binding transcriptional ArsR family regulator
MHSETDRQIRLKARIFNALSDPTRLEILEFLRTNEKCVCEIIPFVGLMQPVVSRHLKILKDVGIVRCRKDGTKRMYSIVDNRVFNVIDSLAPEVVGTLTKEAIEHVTCR